jgi:NAD(P)H dehydrogenase (quinone)
VNIIVLVAHPDKRSFNHAIAETCLHHLKKLGHEVFYHDLYAEKFDPVLTADEIPKTAKSTEIVELHCVELKNSDGIIIVHPNWWGQPPAILKGWVDRILRPGIAYEFLEGDNGEGIPVGLLKMHTALVFNTSNTSKEREENIFLDPLENLWKNCIFYFCGVKIFYRKMFCIMVTSSEEQRSKWIKEVETTVKKYFSKVY